jgi:hypothetical protein
MVLMNRINKHKYVELLIKFELKTTGHIWSLPIPI